MVPDGGDEADESFTIRENMLTAATNGTIEARLKEIEAAIARITNNFCTAAVCQVYNAGGCLINISGSRLDVVPEARFCVRCQEAYQKRKRNY